MHSDNDTNTNNYLLIEGSLVLLVLQAPLNERGAAVLGGDIQSGRDDKPDV